MMPFLRSEATILLTPDAGWNWVGWDGTLTVYAQHKPLLLSGDNVVIESDVQLFSLMLPRNYNTNEYFIPGTIAPPGIFMVDRPTLYDKLVINASLHPLVLSSTGKFRCDFATPAMKPRLGGPVPDPARVKTGKWKVVEPNQNVFIRQRAGASTLSGNASTVAATEKAEKGRKIVASFPGRQHHSNCGIQSSKFLMQLVSCPGDIDPKVLDDETLFHHSLDKKFATVEVNKKGVLEEGFTTPDGREEIMAEKEVVTTQEQYSAEALGDALRENKPVILQVDVKFLTSAMDDSGNNISTGWEGHESAGHAITAIDYKDDNKGNIDQVLVGDTGSGSMYWMKADVLDKAIQEHPNRSFLHSINWFSSPDKVPDNMNVSKLPIKTKCKK